ncbi:MAG: Gfo/Idh/MocA family protein, partial [Halobacteriaceae archaeon]
MSLSVGVVGLGGRGQTQARAVDATGHAVAAGADVDSGARERFAEAFDAPTYGDHDALLAAGVDAVVVTTPNAYHAPASVAALEAGVPVLCEKPLADSLEAAERIREA